MKKLLAVVVGLVMVLGTAGHASADYDWGTFVITLGEVGREVSVDLGNVYDNEWKETTIDTGLTTKDYWGYEDYWQFIQLAAVGCGRDSNYMYYGLNGEPTVADSLDSKGIRKLYQGSTKVEDEAYQTSDDNYLHNYIDDNQAKNTGVEVINLGVFGSDPNATISLDLYSFLETNDTVTVTDGGYDLLLYLDDDDGTLVAQIVNTVPVPGGLWLMITGLLGALGLQRKHV